MSITACGCKPGRKGPRPDNCRCARISSETLVLHGCVSVAPVIDKDQAVKCFMTTYYLTVENKLGVALCNVCFYLDTRTICKSKCGPQVTPGACCPDSIQVLLSSVDSSKGCPCSKTVDFNGSGLFLCLPLLKPGTSVFTVVMTSCDDCCDPCPQLPAIFSVKLKQCCTRDTAFVTSTIIGCLPSTIRFPKTRCCKKKKPCGCGKKECDHDSSTTSTGHGSGGSSNSDSDAESRSSDL